MANQINQGLVFPRNGVEHFFCCVKLAVLYAISQAHYPVVYACAWAADSINARIRLAAENDGLQQARAIATNLLTRCFDGNYVGEILFLDPTRMRRGRPCAPSTQFRTPRSAPRATSDLSRSSNCLRNADCTAACTGWRQRVLNCRR